jgi:putative ABC transport system permease protein
MRGGAVRRAVAAGLTRRRVQTIVIGLVLLVSTGVSVLALALLVDSNAPFDHAFVTQRGADTVTALDSGRVTDAQLAATTRLPEVTAAAGPFAEATITPTISGQKTCSGGPCLPGGTYPQMTLAGRSAPGGPVDDLTLQSGHWADGPGQVVLGENQAGARLAPLGTTITAQNVPGHPRLTVVGVANSVTGTADGWVTPSEIAMLRSPGTPDTAQMLYRFRSAGTSAELSSDLAAVARALPPGAITDSSTYLAAKTQETGSIAPFVPFLIAFGVIGLVMSVLIVTNVISGAVVAGYRRIGVLKSVGFTPAQVVGAYTGQVAVPAVAGTLAGVVLGNLVAVPVLAQTASSYGVGTLGVPIWADVAVPVAILAVVAIAAVLPALRAGRLSAVQAIATGRAPRTGRGYAAYRLLGKLPLPRAVTIGLAGPFARPARSMVTLAAVLLGAITVTLAVGLSSSLNLVAAGLSRTQAVPVQVMVPGAQGLGGPIQSGPGGVAHNGPVPTAGQAQHAIETALAGEPGTLHYVAEVNKAVKVAGLTQNAVVTAYRGDSGWTGYDMISGHWFTGPDQAVAPARFLTETGQAVGDTVNLTDDGKQAAVRIVGENFGTGGISLITDWQTLSSIDPGVAPTQYEIGLRSGTDEAAYIQSLSSELGDEYVVLPNNDRSTVVDLMISLIGTLTVALAVVAGLGVLNTVVLNTRERVHDLGVFKAVGMTPGQAITMAVCWVAGIGLIAGVIAVPAGVALHRWVLPAMAAAANVGLPAKFLNVYHGPELVALGLAGIAIAVAGALLPAGWAAKIRTASALRAE